MATKFSKTDKKQMQLAFISIFGVKPEVAEHPKIAEWMESAPVGIVEWEGTFQNENPKSRDYRMQRAEVYDGDIHKLVEYLREIFPEQDVQPKWNLILSVYKGIKDCSDVVRAVETSLVFGDDDNNGKPENQADEPTTSSDSSTDTKAHAEVSHTMSERQPAADTSVSYSGKADESSDSLLSNKAVITENKEETKMADESAVFNEQQNASATPTTGATGNQALDDLMAAAASAAPEVGANLDQQQNPGITGQTTGGQVAMPKIGSEYIDSTQKVLAEDLPRRIEWGKNNSVSRVITKAEPSSLRIVDASKGVISTGEEAARKKTIENIMTKFAKAVGANSWNSMTDEQSLDERFPHVTGIGDQKRAEAVRQLLIKLDMDPMAFFPVYVNDKPTWSVCGVEMNGSDKLSMAEFRDMAIADSPGAVYAKNMLVNGAPVADPTAFILTMVKGKTNTKNAKGSKPGSGKNEGAVGVWAGQMRIANKPKFVENKANVLVIFPTVQNATEEQMKYVGAKAVVTVDGKEVAATFKYEVYKEDGTPEYIATDKKDKDGNPVAPKKRTRTFNLNLRTLVKLTESTACSEIGDAKKYNVSPIGQSTKEMKDYTDIEALKKDLYGKKDKDEKHVDNSEAALVRLLAAAAAGVTNMKIDASSKAAQAINGIKAKAQGEQAAQDARDEADVL